MKASFKAQIKKVQAKYDRAEEEIVSVITLQMPASATNMHILIDHCEKWVDVNITDNQIEMWPEDKKDKENSEQAAVVGEFSMVVAE